MEASTNTTDNWASTVPPSTGLGEGYKPNNSPWQDRQVPPQEACVGSIVWLRQRFDGDEEIKCVRPRHCNSKMMLEEGYRHPVTILKIWQRPGSTVSGDLMLGVSDVSPCQTISCCQLRSVFRRTNVRTK
jgi:hypothetical protein